MKYRTDWLNMLLVIVIAIGVCFRFINLDGKVYWHDEAYTSLRAAGFTRQEIDNTLFQNQFFSPSDLQQFQQIKPDSTIADTIHSLAAEDPQHPPLYYVMARGWMQMFGSSMTASRSLPALLSLLALPCMYSLAIELFASPLAALLATALLSLSPFDILFAQTARQYSLLTVFVIGSSWLLLRAIRRSTWQDWSGYVVAVALGLYTHPFFALTVIGHGVYVLLLRKLGLKFLLAIAAALVLYSPWLFVLFDNLKRADATTGWTKINIGFLHLVKQWTLSFTSLFIDLNFDNSEFLTYLGRVPFILLIIAAFYVVIHRTSRSTWLFIVTSSWIPFLLLAIPDVVMGGKRSAVSRYLISCYPGIQLAVAYLFTIGLQTRKQLWQGGLAMIFTIGLISCLISAQAETWWSKSMSYWDAAVIRSINTEVRRDSVNLPSLVVVSDIGDDYTNTGELLALSYNLDPSLRLFLASRSPDLSPLSDEPKMWTFRLSKSLKEAIEQQGWQLESGAVPSQLATIKR